MRMSNDQKFGLKWEKWVLARLHEEGYSEARLVSNWYSDRDIMLGTMPIEVKAANGRKHWSGKCLRTRWQFDVSRGPRHTDHVVILVAIDHNQDPFPFVIPSWAICLQHNVHVTSHPTAYRGRFAPYLGQWWQVEVTKSLHERFNGQQCLIMGTGDSAINITEWGQKSGSATIIKTLSPFPIGAAL